MRLVGRASGEIRRWATSASAGAAICQDRDDGQMLAARWEVEVGSISLTIADWSLRVLPSVKESLLRHRDQADAREAGGVRLGAWDRTRNFIYVIEALGPPPDSVREVNGFVRGAVGLDPELDRIAKLTMGNVGYIGEWHTHPKGHVSRLSRVDLEFLDRMHGRVQIEDSPPLMMVAGDDGIRVALATADDRVDGGLV